MTSTAVTARSEPAHRTIEEICTIAGTKTPAIPPIPADSVPNLESIRKVYNIAFAPGLDKLLESGPSRWFANDGFKYLAADRIKLGGLLAYLTLVSNNHGAAPGENATLASQEARVTWSLLELCVRPEHDGGEVTDKLARRCRALTAVLTKQSFNGPGTSVVDFVHHGDPETEPKSAGTFQQQLTRRSERFWNLIESTAAKQGGDYLGDGRVNPDMITQCRDLLDGMENRDIIYSVVLLSLASATTDVEMSNGGSGAGAGRGGAGFEQDLARRYLERQATGRATNQVFATIAGMALRAF